MNIKFFPLTPLLSQERNVLDIRDRFDAIRSTLSGDLYGHGYYRLGLLDYLSLGLYPMAHGILNWWESVRDCSSFTNMLAYPATLLIPPLLAFMAVSYLAKHLTAFILSIPLTALLTTYKAAEYALTHSCEQTCNAIVNS